MSIQTVCDDCGKPIDTTLPHFVLNGSKVQMVDTVLTTLDPPVSLHYHEAHVPGYKFQGAPVDPETGKVIDPPPEDPPVEPPVEDPPEDPPEPTEPIAPTGGEPEPGAPGGDD